MDLHTQPLPIEQTLLEKYDPQSYLLHSAQPTDIPLVYFNKKPVIHMNLPLVWIVFGPGGVGKDTVTKPLYDAGTVLKVQTATSRPRRVHEGEPENYYLWMRQKDQIETHEEYVQKLVNEYRLIEHIDFNGYVYGTPMVNLEKAMQQGTPMLVITTEGVVSLQRELAGKANIVSVFIVPENYGQLYNRILNRENPERRLRISVDEVRVAPELANYYLYNPVHIDGQEGLSTVQTSLARLLTEVQSKISSAS